MSHQTLDIVLSLDWRVLQHQPERTTVHRALLLLQDVEDFVQAYASYSEYSHLFSVMFTFLLDEQEWDHLWCFLNEVHWYEMAIPALLNDAQGSAIFHVDTPELHVEFDQRDNQALVIFTERQDNRAELVALNTFIEEWYRALYQLDLWSRQVLQELESTCISKFLVKKMYKHLELDAFDAYLKSLTHEEQHIARLWMTVRSLHTAPQHVDLLRKMQRYLYPHD